MENTVIVSEQNYNVNVDEANGIVIEIAVPSVGQAGYTGSAGPIGYTGSQGDIGGLGYTGSAGIGYTGSQGVPGIQGTIGFTGSQGAQGLLGYTGSAGVAGIQGVMGFTGSAGANGATGFTGSSGSNGAVGFTGSAGSAGAVGYTGSQGIQGVTGFTGSSGSAGTTGFTGSAGVVGYTGSTGANGSIGFTGSQGAQGTIGFTGSAGVDGVVGFTGSTGIQGIQGYTGSQGVQGAIGFTGSQGVAGATGFTGSAGSNGFTGSKGDIGYTGSAGVDGAVGYTGSQGPIGYTGSSSQIFDILTLNLAGYTGSLTGQMWYDAGEQTVSAILNDQVTLQLGQEALTLCWSNVSISNGTVVRLTGAQGQRPVVDIADVAYSQGAFGVATQDIAMLSEGFVTTYGLVHGLNTAAFAPGDKIWLSTSGAFTNVQPAPNSRSVHIGHVIRSHAASGSIFVDIENEYRVQDLRNTNITAPQNGQVLMYDNTAGTWYNATPPAAAGYTGSQGDIGYTGSAGTNGSTGFTGSAGTNGFTGSQGIQGITGFTGSQGIQGDVGFTGSAGIQGTTGFTGSQGVQGAIGFTGSAGTNGSTGFTGSTGYTGSQGTVGYTGSIGATGVGIPDQTGHASQFLTTDGTNTSWWNGPNVISFTKAAGTTSNIPVEGVSNGNQLTLATSLTLQPTAVIYTGDNNVGWKDIVADITVRGLGVNNPTWTAFRNGISAYAFDASTMNECWLSFHINHDYAVGTPIYLHIHWANAGTNTGVVRWGFEYTIAKGHQQEAFPATSTVYVEQACTGQYTHQIAEISPGITSTSLEPDSLILVRVFRDASHANDTNTNAVCVFTSDIHYQANKFATKNKAPNFNV